MFKKILLSTLFIIHGGWGWAAEPTMGTTFSIRQCEYLELDWQATYRAVLDLDFDILRIGAYWSDIETEENKYDFSKLDWQIAEAKKKKTALILTVGMKAPRWPEYFIPAWVLKNASLGCGARLPKSDFVRQRTLAFIEKVIERYRKESIIKFWQVENEALNRFGGRYWMLEKWFLEEEVRLVRQLDDTRPIIVTAATYPNRFLRFISNFVTPGNPIEDNLALGDILGINVYPIIGQSFWQRGYYVRTDQQKRLSYFKDLIELVKKRGKDVWITELQAEPWEPGILAHRGKRKVPSGWPESTKLTLHEMRALGYNNFLFWGVEYWYDQKINHDNPQWWNAIKYIIKNKSQRIFQ